jgi:DNA (cytosine-5)-methyltransferase 1
MSKRTITARADEQETPLLYTQGTQAPWYKGWDLTDDQRDVFRKRSAASRLAKERALRGEGPAPLHPINTPRLDPNSLMPLIKRHGLRSLSLFSGGGGLDLGFDRAGFDHVASFEIIEAATQTLRLNRPKWDVRGGSDGDVRKADWRALRGKVDVLHGGPPCQPFSSAGRQLGSEDVRDMFPEFVRAVLETQPQAFVAENVPALKSVKFEKYVQDTILKPLGSKYKVTHFEIAAESVGVPQVRRRVVFVGFRDPAAFAKYKVPAPTHVPVAADGETQGTLFGGSSLPKCMGAREALGLPALDFDALAPTMRSGFTGPRHSTSILSSVAAQRMWERLKIWPNGVAPDRERAHLFVAKNGHFRLSIQDCALLQGFPADWTFFGAVYVALGQIGNSVAPPVAYAVAKSVLDALR